MRAFLDEVAESTRHQYQSKHVRILFPTKRGKYYFRKYLAAREQKASVYGRNLFTIEEFLVKEGMRGWNVADELTLLLELFQVVKGLPENEKIRGSESFDKFYNLGKIILGDFDDVDNDLVPAEDIFRNLSDIKHIDAAFDYLQPDQLERIRQFWNAFQTKSSEEQQQFLNLWERLPQIYQKFTERLIKQKTGYQGLLYRLFVDKLKQGKSGIPKERQYIAVGFNALNNAQKQIFKHLQKQGQIQFFWDGDHHYAEDKKQEAGKFLRSNIELFGRGATPPPRNLNHPDKTFQVYAVQGNTAQAKVIHELLTKIPEDELHQTAIVLGDEQLLFPVLSAIPHKVDHINVTMGYPFKHTSLYAFIKRYIALHTGTQKKTDAGISYYFQQVISLLRHPYLQEAHPEHITTITRHLYHKQLVYVPDSLLQNEESELLQIVFGPVSGANALFTNLLNLLFQLFIRYDKDENTQDTINKEFIYQTYRAIQRLKDTITGNIRQLKTATAVKLLDDHLKEFSIPFEAASQDGLQIMGLMETRNIDFRHVILLSANEGIIPKITTPPSFISESLRYGFGLPVIARQDAIFAYVFYSLIQRATRIDVLYNSLTNEDTVGEVSRFVKQLRHETQFGMDEHTVKPTPIPVSWNAIEIDKNAHVMEILNQYHWRDGYAQKTLSPSAIADYIACPLKFYYSKIAGLKEPEEIEDEVSYAAFGNILHYTMHKLYADHAKNKGTNKVAKADFNSLKNQLNNAVIASYKKHYNIPPEQTFAFEGNQQVIKQVLIRYGTFILNKDKQYAPFRILSLEKRMDFSNYIDVEVAARKKNMPVALNGVIDRVDEKDGTIRIVDYKTGKAQTQLNDAGVLFTPRNINEKKGLIQILQYAWLYRLQHKNAAGNIKPVLYTLREMSANSFTGEIHHKDGVYDTVQIQQLLDDFSLHLKNKLSEIFNPQIPFTQTADKKNCTYCPFNTICAIYE